MGAKWCISVTKKCDLGYKNGKFRRRNYIVACGCPCNTNGWSRTADTENKSKSIWHLYVIEWDEPAGGDFGEYSWFLMILLLKLSILE